MVVLLTLVVVGGLLFAFNSGMLTQTQLPSDTSGTNANVAVNPVASYSTVDKFSTSTCSGTAYYQRDGEEATTTALTNVNPGVEYTYGIIGNATYYTKPIKFVAGNLNNNIVNKECFTDYNPTLAGYDNNGRATFTSGVANVTLASSGTSNLEVSYQGTAKKSAMPFGGIMAVEMNSSITSVACSGANIVADDGSQHLTYTVSATTHKVKFFKVLPSVDDGKDVSKRIINCQFQNGATTVGTGATFKVVFYPANYYITNDNKFALDTEKFLNDDTTRAGLDTFTLTGYWA